MTPPPDAAAPAGSPSAGSPHTGSPPAGSRPAGSPTAATPAPRAALAWAALVHALCTLALGFPALAGKFLVNPYSDQYIAGYSFREFARSHWHRVGEIQREHLNDLDAAIAAYRGVLDELPSDTGAMSALESIYEARSAWEDLREILERRLDAAETPAQRIAARVRLARLMEKSFGKRAEAMAQLQEILDEEPKNGEALDEMERLFAEWVTKPVALSSAHFIRSHFGVLMIDGVEVEIMGDIQNPDADGAWSEPSDFIHHSRLVETDGMRIPVLSLEYEEQAYRKMGRIEKADMLKQWLLDHPQSTPTTDR